MSTDSPGDLSGLTRKLAKRELELLRFWNLSNDILAIFRREVEEIFLERISPSVEEILGWSPEDMMGHRISEYVIGETLSFPAEGQRDLRSYWKSMPGSKIPDMVELSWTTSPWILSNGEAMSYAVARPTRTEAQRNSTRRWTNRSFPGNE